MKRSLANRIALLFSALLWSFAPHAAAAGDSQEGKSLAARWCHECHLSSGGTRTSDVGPQFAQIANDPAYTDTRLRGRLNDPHPPMPKFELDHRRIESIIAYIRSLKR